MYRVLYRKYRPRIFADVIGQKQVTETLRQQIREQKLAHAYLFTGSRGTGKTTCSKILSKAVNCLAPENGDPCGKCAVCRGIDSGEIMDVSEIDAASNNGVEDVRILREEANFTPSACRYRVFIIDEVHMLSIGAFNALLKTLEEPPPHVIFILATTEVHKLPATILSRCQRFEFRRIPAQDIADRLMDVCQKEQTEIDRDAALLIAGVADGAVRDSLSLLDQCMGKSEHITEALVREAIGIADKSSLTALADCIIRQDSAGAVTLVDSLYQGSKDMARLCSELAEHFRALMLIRSMKQSRHILVMSEEDYQAASAQAQQLSLGAILSMISTLQSAYERMNRGVNRRIEMEMTLVRLCQGSSAADPAALEARVSELESIVRRWQTAPPAAPSRELPRSSAPAPAPPVKRPSSEEMEKLRKEAVPMTAWPDVIEDIKKYSKTVAAGFVGSKAYISGKYVLVESSNDICFEILRKPAQRDKMRDSIKRVTGKEYKLGRYSYPDEPKADDALSQLMSDFQSAGIPVDHTNKN